ncbi:MAG: helix-turn-helix transcriptional regulator [Flavisolibacter sp.]|jgi:DNA-binding CsgD family transcriptional regulator|nr:helix-turn-helix transcriptional regulator [Flavisolibacter sp.]
MASLLITKSGIITHCKLTNREREILIHVKNGLMNREIAAIENISLETVKTHLKNAYKKLNARNKIEALRLANFIK